MDFVLARPVSEFRIKVRHRGRTALQGDSQMARTQGWQRTHRKNLWVPTQLTQRRHGKADHLRSQRAQVKESLKGISQKSHRYPLPVASTTGQGQNCIKTQPHTAPPRRSLFYAILPLSRRAQWGMRQSLTQTRTAPCHALAATADEARHAPKALGLSINHIPPKANATMALGASAPSLS